MSCPCKVGRRLYTEQMEADVEQSNRGHYVAKPESPYELSMICDKPVEGVQCVAYVYSKKHCFQHRMGSAAEAVTHTDELIRVVDRTIDQWNCPTVRERFSRPRSFDAIQLPQCRLCRD